MMKFLLKCLYPRKKPLVKSAKKVAHKSNGVPRKKIAPVNSSNKKRVLKNNDSKTSSGTRKKLMEEALEIHRRKSKILDNLSPDARKKLNAIAMAIYFKQQSDNKNN